MLPNCNWLVRHIGLEGIHPHMQEEERKSKTLVFENMNRQYKHLSALAQLNYSLPC